jgi:ATP-dependent DNA helicase RecQ
MPERQTATDPLFDRADSRDPLAILKRVYGYSGFRGKQADVVHQVVSGGDAVVLFPTGAGKSMCYQMPALVPAMASASSSRR